MVERFQEIERLLAEPSIVADKQQFKSLSKEHAQLEVVVRDYTTYAEINENLHVLQELSVGADQDLAAMAFAEIKDVSIQQTALQTALHLHLIPRDPADERNVYLEIRAGAGGDEAAIFAGDLFRMYSRYAESQNWHSEIISANLGEH